MVGLAGVTAPQCDAVPFRYQPAGGIVRVSPS